MLTTHPFNDPQAVALEACRAVSKGIAREVRAATPVRTGKLKRSVKPVARRVRGDIVVGVKLLWYGVPLNARKKFVSRSMEPRKVLSDIAEEVRRSLMKQSASR